MPTSHARYRRANKITDNDLHTLGDGLVEILNVIEIEEWRGLIDVECHWYLSQKLRKWTISYEEEVARPTAINDQYVRVYVASAISALPSFIRTIVRQMLSADLDDVMRTSLCIESPSSILVMVLGLVRYFRKLFVRYLALPRPPFLAVKLVHDTPNPETNSYNFEPKSLQSWYVRPTFWSKWGPGALLVRILGGDVPGSRGDRYEPQGYNLMSIGSAPQKEKGLEEMRSDMDIIRARGVATCPLSQANLVTWSDFYLYYAAN
ncbi:conserved hypothetical protein [Talaromyces stipitatus ATCC 10500]|uniref:Uncharacterized protein n=1 Tax=Talaromyces stipitatus (strain ATCC 10500 / CBS 375.48 / QM 6759 / NRRL 1006) TaxID=441959 RepID=B8MLL6_TALSN|nr:uncharacterized protein TSTA_049870 [Talaromyces stipitatus ATCC 10500]EED15549.1 conserved hypothetical protein [Talaromyces stipitatus ATCC 10500]